LWTRKGLVPTLFALILSTVIVLPVGMALTIPVVAQASSMPTFFIDPPTINGTVIDQEFTVNISIRDSYQIKAFGVGMTFNPSLLNCTGIFQGDFLKKVGTTMWVPGSIDNTAGIIGQSVCIFQDPTLYASGDGQLAYVTFKVKALGVSDLHLRDVELVNVNGEWIEFNIIDVYTVTEVTPPQTVVTVSRNCTSYKGTVHSGLSNHAFNQLNKEISFTVTVPPIPGLISGSSNVTIPKALLSPEPSYSWGVIIDSRLLKPSEITITENATHTFIYFTYDAGIHNVQITTRILISTISISLSSTVIALGSDVTISGDIDPVRQNVNVTILYKPSGGTWTTLGTNQTDSNSHYSYTWTPTEAGTYEIKASWDGDSDTLGAESIVETLEVIPKELVVSLDAPGVVRLGGSALLNATVYNFGPNETNVELQLFINGSMVDSTVVPFLERDSNYTLSYLWTPAAVEATYNVTAYAPPLTNENVTINNVATKFVAIKFFFIGVNPDSGPIGTKATVNGWYIPTTQVRVTFNDMLIGYATTDENGDFTFVFNIPVSVAGMQTVKAFDVNNASISTENVFTVVDVTPLSIGIDVGTIHFRGESAEFYIQITFEGTTVNATSVDATLYSPNNEIAHYLFPENITLIATGFYKITYPILEDAPNGTYVLVVEASYSTDAIEAHGTSFKTFLLSPTLTTINATLISLNGTVALVETEIGIIETDVANIGLRVTEINGSVVTIQTTLGTIEGKIVSIEGDIVTIKTDIGTLETDVGTLGTDIGTLQGDVSSVKGSQEAFSTLLYIVVALALIAAIGAIFTILIFLRRKPTP